MENLQEKKKESKVKKVFNIEQKYKFEFNDIRAVLTVLNVVLIMTFGLSIAWFGLAISFIGFVKDLTTDRHINGIIMHLSTIALNVYFIILAMNSQERDIMFIETVVKVKLNDEEKEALKKIHKLVNDIYDKTDSDEIEFEDGIADILDDLQTTIKCIIT